MTLYPYDVIIVGGALAGLTSLIHMAKSNFKVLLIKKNAYQKHKVCGESVSNEILSYFGVKIYMFGGFPDNKFALRTLQGEYCTVPKSEFGIYLKAKLWYKYQISIR